MDQVQRSQSNHTLTGCDGTMEEQKQRIHCWSQRTVRCPTDTPAGQSGIKATNTWLIGLIYSLYTTRAWPKLPSGLWDPKGNDLYIICNSYIYLFIRLKININCQHYKQQKKQPTKQALHQQDTGAEATPPFRGKQWQCANKANTFNNLFLTKALCCWLKQQQIHNPDVPRAHFYVFKVTQPACNGIL